MIFLKNILIKCKKNNYEFIFKFIWLRELRHEFGGEWVLKNTRLCLMGWIMIRLFIVLCYLMWRRRFVDNGSQEIFSSKLFEEKLSIHWDNETNHQINLTININKYIIQTNEPTYKKSIFFLPFFMVDTWSKIKPWLGDQKMDIQFYIYSQAS